MAALDGYLEANKNLKAGDLLTHSRSSFKYERDELRRRA
jgi:hypothetical protein